MRHALRAVTTNQLTPESATLLVGKGATVQLSVELLPDELTALGKIAAKTGATTLQGAFDKAVEVGGFSSFLVEAWNTIDTDVKE